jgi:hypothetical protein
MDTLDFLVRFWELRARYDRLGVPLSDRERLELLSLIQMVSSASVASSSETRCGTRRGIPMQLTAGSGFLAADLRELRTDGLVVGAAEPIGLGTRTIAYVADAVSGFEYSLPCVVTWLRQEEPWLMGLMLDGLPTRAQFAAPVSALMRSPLGHPSLRVQA